MRSIIELEKPNFSVIHTPGHSPGGISLETIAKNFDRGHNLISMRCYEVTGSKKQHQLCPAQNSLRKGKYTEGYYDFGDENFFVLTLPLANKYVVKPHAFFPKQFDSSVEEM